mgnify:CR=1 FL=1
MDNQPATTTGSGEAYAFDTGSWVPTLRFVGQIAENPRVSKGAKKGFVLPDLNKYKKDEKITIFHSGTKLLNNKIISDGGRVFSVTALGENVKDCRKEVYRVLDSMNWPHGFFRKDIGKIIE